MPNPTPVTVFMFTDIEGSTRLWERAPQAMQAALARHDAIAAESVTSHGGRVVKSTGDGVHAVFADPLAAVEAALAMQVALADADFGDDVRLAVRTGLHAGVDSERGNDFYGTAVNRAARIMSAAHGGQILVSGAVAALMRERLPQDVALRSLGRVRLRDLSEPEDVHQVVHPRLRVDFPALRSLESTPNNLPHGLTSFIGREREVAEVRHKLRAARLLTIVGMGGLGKSRLSLRVAAASLDHFPDGVFFVELAPVGDPRLVAQAVATVLGIREDAGQSPQDAVVRFVHDRRLLVVLDNCEHVTQACAEIARAMLEAGPAVTILATSRERLGIAAEQTYPLAPFAVPPRDTVAPDDLAAFASVRFLSERATAAQPDFAITRDNAGAVAAICQQLDGIPLALELAAARLRSMPVSAIAERLGDRFRLLSGGDRTASPRQQTLRALIDWSYDLLSPEERSLFGRLSMFAGGFTLEAAEAIGIDEGRAPDLLSQLVDKSLVSFEPSRSRYGMLETVRRYARDKLAASGDDAAARAAYVAWHADWIEKAGPLLLGPEQGMWMQRIDVELDNLLSAHAACEELPDAAQAGLRLANSLKHYWLSRGLLDLGLRTTLAALERWKEADVDRGRGLFNAGQFAIAMGRYAEAQAYLENCLTIAREMGQRIGAVLQPLGQAAMCRGDLASAKTYLQEALALAQASAETRSIAAALNGLAHLHRLEGDFDAAAVVCRQAVELARAAGDRESTAIGLLEEAVIAIERGVDAGVKSMLRGALEILAETGSRWTARSALDVLTALAITQGDRQAAGRFHRAAEALLAQTQARRNPADDLFLRRYTRGLETAAGRDAEVPRDSVNPEVRELVAGAAAWLSRDAIASDS